MKRLIQYFQLEIHTMAVLFADDMAHGVSSGSESWQRNGAKAIKNSQRNRCLYGQVENKN